jgi:hypothetical protein
LAVDVYFILLIFIFILIIFPPAHQSWRQGCVNGSVQTSRGAQNQKHAHFGLAQLIANSISGMPLPT